MRYRWKRRGRNQKGLQGWSTKQSSDRAQRFRFLSYKATILSVVRGHPEFPRSLQGFCKVKIIILVVLRHYFPFSLYIHPDTKTRVGKTTATLAVAPNCTRGHCILHCHALNLKKKKTLKFKKNVSLQDILDESSKIITLLSLST